jgi:hypothetical protein
MRLKSVSLLTGLTILLASNSLLAHPNSGHMDKAQWTPDHETKIGDKDFTPGNYQLSAMESGTSVSIFKDGKMVAEVPCHWTQLPQKASDTAVFTDTANNVTQVQFSGRTAAIQFP